MWDATLKDTDVKKVVDALGVNGVLLERSIVVAGGFIRDIIVGDEPRDIDLYTDYHNTMYRPSLCPNIFIDRVRVPRPMLKYLISTIDFTVCCCVIGVDAHENYISTCHSRFYEDLANRRLDIDISYRKKDMDWWKTLLNTRAGRYFKLLSRGYTMDVDKMQKLYKIARKKVGNEHNSYGTIDTKHRVTERGDMGDPRGTEPVNGNFF